MASAPISSLLWQSFSKPAIHPLLPHPQLVRSKKRSPPPAKRSRGREPPCGSSAPAAGPTSAASRSDYSAPVGSPLASTSAPPLLPDLSSALPPLDAQQLTAALISSMDILQQSIAALSTHLLPAAAAIRTAPSDFFGAAESTGFSTSPGCVFPRRSSPRLITGQPRQSQSTAA
ncbi:uncharacterized protein PAE49_024461 [Odontesthes bonariensis]